MLRDNARVRFAALRCVLGAGVIMATLFAVAPPAHAARSSSLRLTGTIHESPAPDALCGGLRNQTHGVLKGTLGTAQWSSVECIDATVEPGGFVIRDGRFALKTSQGSLTGTLDGHASQPNARGHLYFSGRFTITNGSQRYEGAKGSGLAIADVDVAANTAELDLAGTLSYRR